MGVTQVIPNPCQEIVTMHHTCMNAHSHHATLNQAGLRTAILIYLPLCHKFVFDLPFQVVRGYLDSLD